VDTFKSFESCIDWAISSNFSDQDVDEAKLGVFSQVSVLSMINLEESIDTCNAVNQYVRK